MPQPIKVQIVAAVHNRKEITLQCIKSLLRCDETGMEVGIVIVDDGSTDGTGDAIRQQYPEVEVVQGNGDLFYTEGTNVGVRAAFGHDPDYVLMINDDAVFDGGFLRFMVETAERYPRSIIGSLLLLWDEPHKIFQVSPKWDVRSGGWLHWRNQTVWTVPEDPWEVDVIVGNCVLVPVKAFHEFGLMDSKRYPNFGDAEFTPRMRKKGYRLIMDPRARVFCQPNALPKRIGTIGVKGLFDALIVDLKHPHNFRRRFYALVDSAPTKLQGFAAFCVFVGRLVLRINAEAAANSGSGEKPLSELYSSRVLRDQ